jgi:flagellar biosynthesis component FlhA
MEKKPPNTISVNIFLRKKPLWSLAFNQPKLTENREALEHAFKEVQETLFNETGVICPKINIQEASDIPADIGQLQINGEWVTLSTDLTPENIVSSVTETLRHNVGKLLSAELVEHYLTNLKQTYPDLIDITLERFSIEDLTLILKARLDEQSSIKNLPGILEELMETGT